MKEKLNILIRATTEKNKLPLRVLLAFFGVLVMGFGMSVLELLDFGTDPFTCMNIGISNKLEILIGTAALIVQAVLFAVVIFTDISKLGIGTVFNMVGFGYTIDLFRLLWRKVGFTGAEGAARYILLAVSLVVFIIAVAVYLAADLGSSPYDATPVIIAQKTKIRFVYVRVVWDVTVVVIGFLLGSTVGITTLVCALFVGPAAALVRRVVDRMLA